MLPVYWERNDQVKVLSCLIYLTFDAKAQKINQFSRSFIYCENYFFQYQEYLKIFDLGVLQCFMHHKSEIHVVHFCHYDFLFFLYLLVVNHMTAGDLRFIILDHHAMHGHILEVPSIIPLTQGGGVTRGSYQA